MAIGLYVSKPIEVEAALWDGTAETAQEILDWVPKDKLGHLNVEYDLDYGDLEVWTASEDWVTVPVGNLVVIDTKGFPYPCDPDIFAADKEAVTV